MLTKPLPWDSPAVRNVSLDKDINRRLSGDPRARVEGLVLARFQAQRPVAVARIHK